MHYRYQKTVFHIAVLQTSAGNGEMRVSMDGTQQHDKTIPWQFFLSNPYWQGIALRTVSLVQIF